METVRVSKLREHLVSFLKRVELGEDIIITSRGRRVARLVPLGDKMKKAREALQQLRKNAVVGDVISPVGERWEVIE
ncbi:MAG: type II toxin-antitoxin system prevent-host-death family antitoxin [Thermodesulfobacteriota bacterium]|nr:type II toxin-antitoxin system prevent-host-death family antitoxin [Thermodesulfobacteriota bacterium]